MRRTQLVVAVFAVQILLMAPAGAVYINPGNSSADEATPASPLAVEPELPAASGFDAGTNHRWRAALPLLGLVGAVALVALLWNPDRPLPEPSELIVRSEPAPHEHPPANRH